MGKRLFKVGLGLCVGLGLVAAGGLLCAFLPAKILQAQVTSGVPDAPPLPGAARGRMRSGQLPGKPSQPPVFTIPVEPLGFSAPGPFYQGQRNTLASLDFLDEDRLLFTFRVPGLIRRAAVEEGTGESDASQDAIQERQIRALLLTLPAGTVAAEALWTVHDRARYLWMLGDGHFLLRDRNNLEQGDATLELKPFLHFPGALLWLEMDPTGQLLVTDSREPEAPDSAAASVVVEGKKPVVPPEMIVRILRRDSGQMMLSSRARSTVHLPINADGYLESVRAKGNEWLMNLKYFQGGSAILGRMQSTCSPVFDFLSEREVLVTTCLSAGADKLAAMTTEGRLLWEEQISGAVAWPLLVRSPDGLRMAREALVVSHSAKDSLLLGQDQIKGQRVQVLDAADGKVALETYATPALDAGGNVAISPSGRRVAVLNDGAIQVFELPAPPPLR